MSGITQAQAQANLDALLAAQSNNILSVSIGGRTVSYRNMADLTAAINYWSRVLAGLQRKASGQSRHGMSAASFRSSQ